MKIISLEGIDGTGKTSILKGLKEIYVGYEDVRFVSFPSEWFRERYALASEMYEGSELVKKVNELQTADKERAYNYFKDEGVKVLFCDRFEVSQKVYDGNFLGKENVGITLKSDFIIYIEASLDTVFKRIGERSQDDYLSYETREILASMRDRYEDILSSEYEGKYERILVDGGMTEEDVLREVVSILDKREIL